MNSAQVLEIPPWLIGSLITIAIFLLGQLIAGVWWAATMNSELRHLNGNVIQLSQNAEIHHADQTRTVTALGTKHDQLATRVTVVETRCLAKHGE